MNFKELFKDQPGENYPQKREYQGKTIFLVDKFPVSNQDRLVVSIEETNSKYTQGMGIDVYGSCKFLGKRYKKGKHVFTCFWEDAEGYDSKFIEIQVFTKENFVFVQNIWEIDVHEQTRYVNGKQTVVKLEGVKDACYAGSHQWLLGRGNGTAMYSEEIEGGRRYFCNDGDLDDDFDDIIFSVRKIRNVSSK